LSARIPLSNPDGRLRLGLYGTARVTALGETTEPVLAVPNSAVTRMLDRTVVFVRHDDGHFEVHDVVLGRSDTDNTEVLHGLNANERVVTQGVFSVKSALLRDRFGEGEH
jgi:cobalt-zinc-cadmium efflux system membrane fusion protein